MRFLIALLLCLILATTASAAVQCKGAWRFKTKAACLRRKRWDEDRDDWNDRDEGKCVRRKFGRRYCWKYIDDDGTDNDRDD